MKLVTCNRCQSQFNVEGFSPGSTFVCGKCRNVLQVPAAAPVVQPMQTVQPMPAAKKSSPPPTVALSPEEMKKALAAASGASAPAAPAKPKLPAAMEARKQQQQTQQRAGGAPPPTVALSPEEMKKALAAATAAQNAPASPPPPPAPRAGAGAPPPVTVALSPEEMRKALALAKGGGAQAAASAVPAAAPRPAPAAAPAPAARSAARPAASAAPVAPAAPAAPAAARTSRRADSAPAEKSKTGLMIGIGVGVLALGGGAFALMSGGGDKKPDTPPAPAPDANLDEFGKWAKLDRSAQDAEIAKRITEAGTDQAKLQAIHAWLGNEKLKSLGAAHTNAGLVLDSALRADPSAEWARTAKGQKKALDFLKQVETECPNAWKNPEADEKVLREALAKAQTDPWVTAQEFAKFEVIAGRVRARESALANNPRRAAFEKKKGWTRDNPLFADMKWIYVEMDPYLISQQYEVYKDESEAHKNKDREKKAKWAAETDALIFRETYRQFLALFGERYKLPKLEDTGRVLHGIITWNRESFDEMYRRNNPGSEITGGIRAFYAPGEQRIFHYLGDDAMRSQDEFKVAGGRIHKEAFQVAAHEETHQLQHEYGAIFRGAPLQDDTVVVRNRRLMWFEEGLAEFMGAFEIDASKKDDLSKATFYHNRILIMRVHSVRGDGKSAGGASGGHRELALKWTLKELFVPNNHPELMKRGGELVSGQGGTMASHFYARSWAFTHFLWYYDNGKYRNAFLDYFESVLKEQQSVGSLCKALGKSGPDDLGGIEKEFNWYWNELLRRPTGRKPGGDKWFEPETEAPTGKYDPNESDDEEEEDGK